MEPLTIRKYEGLGNDFLVLIDLPRALRFDAAQARALCDRHLGIGADGLLRLSSPMRGGDLFMELRNVDGSIAETSGNGIRCAVLAALHEKMIDKNQLLVETIVGTSHAQVLVTDAIGRGEIRVEMGEASIVRSPEFDTATRTAYSVNIGNPHLVLVATVDDGMDVAVIGPSLESVVPGGQNVELATTRGDRARISVDTWERGAGLTLACGTGSCAAVAAAHLAGLVDGRVEVHNPGGDVTVELVGQPDTPGVILTGSARRVGSVSLTVHDLESLHLAVGHHQ
ncbi:MAG TPA: diaminopimelate epimerase [Acidimicrobiales bacterium]|nr:diaminopimelate epimerase [Acidimicrobiales bacterium]